MTDTSMTDTSMMDIEGIIFLEKTNLLSYLPEYPSDLCSLCKNDESMRKIIDNFIQDTSLDISHIKTFNSKTICPKISKLTREVIEVLKRQKNYVTLFFDESFIDKNKLFTMLPEHIKYITLEGTSNMMSDEELELDMTNLPRELIYLDIGYKFKYELTLNHLPEGLKVLRTGAKVDVPVENLPQGLKILEIGTQFSHSIDNLPDSIKILIFKTKCSNWNIYYARPYSSYNLYSKKINKLPLELEVLILDYIHDDVICNIDFSYLDKLTYLALPDYFNEKEFFNSSNIKWPPKLKKLYIGRTYNKVISILPNGLEFLVVHQYFDLEKNLVFVPSSLKKVIVDIRQQIIMSDKCHYGTFKKIQDKFPSIEIRLLSN